METNHVKILKELAVRSPQTSRQLSDTVGAWDDKPPERGPVRVNQILITEAGYGRVRRAGVSRDAYHNTPAFLWELTCAGQEWIDSGDWRHRGRVSVVRAERSAYSRAHRSALIEHLDREARAHDWGPESTAAERRRAIIEMHDLGCTLQAIGDVFGVTREAIRLILVGYKKQHGRTILVGKTGRVNKHRKDRT